MRHRLEYAPVWLLIHGIGVLPRSAARGLCMALAWLVYWLHGRLRRVGLRNLEIAFPEKSAGERRRIVKALFTHLGRQLAEFCLLPRYTKENVTETVLYDGLDNYDAARRRGRGVVILTAHLGGWELGSFVHSLNGHPMHIVVRALDNPYVNRLVDRYRTLHGNTTLDKLDFARGLLGALRAGETVGILMDQNITPPQGVFVDFFGHKACTAGGLAKVALRTDAAVVPGFTIWDEQLRKYRISFDPALELLRSGDEEADVISNTARFTRVIEDCARRYPEQWLWVHRRWKTRPEGEAPLY
ncbi:MAG: lysophospholipid acyltransferase family protein [Acidobacteria bacterium]|nr:lysophospholipid acyltransferase family protein [Acidobacteriota bacterium]